MSRRYNRRSSRPLEDLPSLFGEDDPDWSGVSEPSESSESSESSDEHTVADRYTDPGERMRFISLGSGSSGNCAYVGTDSCGLLIDGGVDNNFVTERLLRNGIDMGIVQGILLTHDHADHVRYSYALLRRNPHMRLYATPRALEGLLRRHNLSRRIKDYHAPIYKEHEYHFGPMTVTPFETSHDGTDNAGFCIACGSSVLVIATDMGMITERADFYMRQATSLVIEANYDAEMLEHGRYPEYLKSRIRGPRGHMDNAETARYLTQITRMDRLRHIFLCHLSNDNNTPAIALETVSAALRERGIQLGATAATLLPGQIYLTALPRYETSDLYML